MPVHLRSEILVVESDGQVVSVPPFYCQPCRNTMAVTDSGAFSVSISVDFITDEAALKTRMINRYEVDYLQSYDEGTDDGVHML